MPYIGVELVIPPQHQPQVLQHRFIQVNHLAAFLADQMVVVTLIRRVISDSSPTKVGLGYQAKPMEQFQCPVHCRYIKMGILGYHLSVYFFSADVMVAVLNGSQDHHALRCQPVTLRAQTFSKIDCFLHTKRNITY